MFTGDDRRALLMRGGKMFFHQIDQHDLNQDHEAELQEETFFSRLVFKKNHAQNRAKSPTQKGEHQQHIFCNPSFSFFGKPFIQPKGEKGDQRKSED